MQGVIEAPPRTADQRLAALERANAVRSHRAAIRAGRSERSARDVLAAPGPMERTWRVLEVLMLCRSVGRVKALRMLSRVGVPPSKAVGVLTVRQRDGLLGMLPSSGRGTVRS